MIDTQFSSLVSFIWGIADDVLRDIYVRGKYRDVILPMMVIRRLDAVLEGTKEDVLQMKARLDSMNVVSQEAALKRTAGQAFYNASPFRLRDLRSRSKTQQLKADFEAYLDGFSSNVQEVLEKFKFRNQIPTLVDADVLGALIEKFLDPGVNLSPEPVLDGDGRVRLPGLDNHAMGTVFEELIRRFNEENNEEAGEHFTPRDVVRLMADLIFVPIKDAITPGTYLVYDGACGTGGMLTEAEKRLTALADAHDRKVSIHLFGQEINPETYAIAKADLLLKGEGEEADNFRNGSTLSQDGFPGRTFDFMLSNPPYGKSWKTDLERMGGKSDLQDPRFVVAHGGEADFSLVTRSSDGQMLFLADKLSKMKQDTPLGSRIAEVHNGSALFTGDAGQGESNIRQWILENDWLEAIIALPLNIFYNTGIATYVWVLTNRKPDHRKGTVQLIDATTWYRPLRKNLGQKNCELAEADIARIVDAFVAFEETEHSRIFPNAHFGYWKVTVERPLRLVSQLTRKAVEGLRFASGDESLRRALYAEFGQDLYDRFAQIRKDIEAVLDGDADTDEDGDAPPAPKLTKKQREKLLDPSTWAADRRLYTVARQLHEAIGEVEYRDHNAFREAVEDALGRSGVKLTAAERKTLYGATSRRDEAAEPVVKKVHKRGTEADPLRGLFATTVDGRAAVVEYEPDTDLRDTEQVPLSEEGGGRGVLPARGAALRARRVGRRSQNEGGLRDLVQPRLLHAARPAQPRRDPRRPRGAGARDGRPPGRRARRDGGAFVSAQVEAVKRLLAELNEVGEHARIEAKTASEMGRSVLETICAFVNEPGLGGGHLLLGVARAETPDLFGARPYTVVGVNDPELLSDTLASQCASAFNRPLRPQITPVVIEGKAVLHVRVDEVQAHDKPVYLTRFGLPRGAFRRISATDQKGTDDDLRTLYASHRQTPYDRELAVRATLDDIDPDAIRTYRKLLSDVDRSAEVLTFSDEELLEALGAAERVAGELKPTVAGILLFGTRLALRRDFAMMRVDYIRVPGNEWVEDSANRYDALVEIRAPLLTALLRAETAVLDDLPKKFNLPEGSLQRQDILPLPRKVLREAIVNALMHRDYRVHGSIQIIRFANRIEIHNPGYSLKPPDQLGQPGSATRNPTLASVFHDTDLAETKGTGIRTMHRLMEEAEMVPPTFESERAENRFTARILLHHFLSKADLEWLAGFGAELSAGDRLVLVHVRDKGAVDNATVRSLTGVDTLTASTQLRRLCSLNLLAKEGQGTATYYQPTSRFLTSLPPRRAPEPTRAEGEPSKLNVQPSRLEREPSKLALQPSTLEDEPSSAADEGETRMPPSLAAQVETLGSRAGQEAMRDLILALCAWKPYTANELATTLGRNADYLKTTYLKPMADAGTLQRTIPDAPSSPNQAYKTPADT